MCVIDLVRLEKPSDDELRQVLELFVQADFTEFTCDLEWLRDAIAGSVSAVAAVDGNNNIVGFIRALGDGVSDCYIQDCVVHKSFRKLGIGRKLVEFLKKDLAERGIDWIGLIATPGNADFYRKLGFEILDGYTPMQLKKF